MKDIEAIRTELDRLLVVRKKIQNMLFTRQSQNMLNDNTRKIAMNTGIDIRTVRAIW